MRAPPKGSTFVDQQNDQKKQPPTRSQEEPGGARGSQGSPKEPGGARRGQGEQRKPGGARRSQQDPGEAGRSQEERGKTNEKQRKKKQEAKACVIAHTCGGPFKIESPRKVNTELTCEEGRRSDFSKGANPSGEEMDRERERERKGRERFMAKLERGRQEP